MANTPKDLYDRDALRKLRTDYKIEFTDFSKWFGTTKNTLYNYLQTVRPTPHYWQDKDWTEEEINLVEKMITKNHVYHEEGPFKIKIYQHKTEAKFAILIINDNDIKCFFEQPDTIHKKLLEEKYHIYDKKDFEIRNEILKSDMLSVEDGEYVVRFRPKDFPELKKIVTTRVNNTEYKTRESYFNFLGFTHKRWNLLTKEEIRTRLQEYLLPGTTNTIFIPIDDPKHDYYHNMSSKKKFHSIERFAEAHGFQYQKRRRNKNLILENQKADELRKKTLENLIAIQGDLNVSTNKIKKRERSQKLARELKKLYAYKCQLCDLEKENFIPFIEKEDGTLYVEVHHIIPVSSADTVQDDALQILDTYQNTVVVCPHHHRVLHYHQGGFSELIREEGNLYFRSNSGEKLKINNNYHLS